MHYFINVFCTINRHTDVIKIGHYSKNNAWSRVAHRGFYSCICPSEIREKVSVGDLELLYWFPSLNSKDEKKIHKSLVDFNVCGEWFHLDALEKLGAKIELKNGYIEATAKKLIGCEINFPGVSVTGTENIMMAAVLAKGQTVLRNVAKEPEVEDLAHFLNAMGAKVNGAGTDEIIIDGVDDLKGTEFSIPADRIEAGTYLIAAAITGGDVTISNIEAPRMNNILDKLKLSGASISIGDNYIQLTMKEDSILPVDISTAPFPGFPTDMQAQFTVLNALSDGSSVVTENVFENRFMHVQELNRMGCDITVKGSNAFIKGVGALNGAPVMATDLRASASLILAGLCAKGETIVDRIYHIDRGYERIEEKLSYLGADITRLPN